MELKNPMISATEATELIKQELQVKISLSTVVRMMERGEIPSVKAIVDKRRRLARHTDVMAWIQRAKEQIAGGTV